MNVMSYLRVSGATQVAGDGFERQDAIIEDFCRGQKLRVVGQYKEALSGTAEGIDRPEFSILLDAIYRSKQHDIIPVEAIVVERMDRLARDLMVSELLLKECRTRGIKVFSADQGNLTDMASDGGDPTRVLIRQIMGALAQWEKSVLVKKLRAAKDRIKASGRMNLEGNKPYGYYPGEAAICKLVVDWHGGTAATHQPPMNFSDIARVLNSMDCKSRSGKPFKPQNVRSIVLNTNARKQSKQ